MFLITGDLRSSYAVKGVVNATVKKTLQPDEIDQVADYDNLYEKVKEILGKRAEALGADGVIDVSFVPEIARVAVGPKYMILHGYGTAVALLKNSK